MSEEHEEPPFYRVGAAGFEGASDEAADQAPGAPETPSTLPPGPDATPWPGEPSPAEHASGEAQTPLDPEETSVFDGPAGALVVPPGDPEEPADEPRPDAVEAEEPASGEDPAEDPFAAWPQPESQTVVEEVPEDVSVEHVSGEIDVPDGYTVLEGAPTGHRRAVAVVVSRFNGGLTNRMLARAIDALEDAGVSPAAVTVVPVPGAFELPLAAMALAKTRRYACVVALGVVVRGETPHFDFVAAEAASGLQLAGIETGVPVAFGVLTVETVEQAEARIDRAAEAVRTALEMADLFARLRASARAG